MEEHRKKCLQSHSDINMANCQFLGQLVTHTQRVAADHRQRHKITRSLGISRDPSTDKQQVDKQSLLSNRSDHSRQEQSESGQDQTRRGLENYSSSSSRDSSPMTGTDSSSESYDSTRTALLAAKKDHKPKRRRSTGSRTGRSTSVNSQTGTPKPRRKEKHPRGLSAERETQQQSTKDKNKSANRRRYTPSRNVTRLTPEEIEAQRPFILPATPDHPPKGV